MGTGKNRLTSFIRKTSPPRIREESLAAIDEGEYRSILLDLLKSKKEIDQRKRRAGPIQQVTPFRLRTRFRKPDHVGLPKPIIQRNRLRGLCRRHGIICSTCFSQTYVKYVNDHSSREKNKFAWNAYATCRTRDIINWWTTRRATFIGKNRIEYATAYLRYEKGGKVQSLIHSLNTMIIKSWAIYSDDR